VSITGTAAANTVIGGSGNDTIDGAGGGGDTIDGAGGADVVVLVGSLRKGALTRKVAKALIYLAPKPLDCCMLEIGDLPLYNEDLDGGPPVARNRADLGLLHVQIILMDAEVTHSYAKHNGSLKRRDPIDCSVSGGRRT